MDVPVSSWKSLAVMRPKRCPFPLIRVGGDGDGAYLIPDDVEGISACFSPGVENRKLFEDELTMRFDIRAHLCDFSSDAENFTTPLIEEMQSFEKKWLDVDGAENSITLDRWVNARANDASDLLLQMDIEGAEVRNLLATSDAVLQRFRIIVLELHGLASIKDHAQFDQGVGALLNKLGEFFICVHAHPNNCCGEFFVADCPLNFPNVIELSFLRRDRFTARDTTAWDPPMMPHPLDIPWNVPHKPPLFLNEFWNDGPRPLDAIIRELEIKLAFSKQAEADLRAEILALAKVYELFVAANREQAVAHGIGDQRREVAAGRPFVLSSGYSGRPSYGLVREQAPFFFHSGFGTEQTITIDLGDDHVITGIEIHNRTDCCQSRARHLCYSLHTDRVPSFGSGRPLDLPGGFFDRGDGIAMTVVPRTTARYVTLFSPHYTAIHLAAIRVYADGNTH